MRKNKLKIFILFLILASLGYYLFLRMNPSKKENGIVKEIKPERETIQDTISTTASVLPKNRLEIKPPVNGRVETVLVKEGEMVKSGQTLALMSSTERAALLDAAAGKGEEEKKYWEEVYNAISLISPIDGEVIVATTQPGQTVTTADAVLVLSDKLIVRAQVDETDIGKVKLGQNALVALDAYPDTKIKAAVEHIYYESKTVNNVTIYEVDLLTEDVPEFFRSGMNCSVSFEINKKEGVLVIPSEAVFSENGQSLVLVKDKGGVSKRVVELGVVKDKKTEIVSGLSVDDIVIIKVKKYSLPKNEEEGTNPFMPQRRQQQRN